jgi:hypothetical protein
MNFPSAVAPLPAPHRGTPCTTFRVVRVRAATVAKTNSPYGAQCKRNQEWYIERNSGETRGPRRGALNKRVADLPFMKSGRQTVQFSQLPLFQLCDVAEIRLPPYLAFRGRPVGNPVCPDQSNFDG